MTGNHHAFDIIEARSVDKYLTKTGLEMSGAYSKQGRGNGHFSPMQLLESACNGEEWACFRFRELFLAVRGLHSLYWSKGLKDRFLIREISDSDIMEGKAGDSLEKVADIENEVFSIMSHRDKSLLLSWAGSGDVSRVAALIGQYKIRSLMFIALKKAGFSKGLFVRLKSFILSRDFETVKKTIGQGGLFYEGAINV